MFYALSSQNQTDFEDRINLFVALAPATKVTHTRSPVIKLTKTLYWFLDRMNKAFNLYRLFDDFFNK